MSRRSFVLITSNANFYSASKIYRLPFPHPVIHRFPEFYTLHGRKICTRHVIMQLYTNVGLKFGNHLAWKLSVQDPHLNAGFLFKKKSVGGIIKLEHLYSVFFISRSLDHL